MINYFAGCLNPDTAKRTYRDLAMQYHPDRGGDLRIMQAINAQYALLLKSFHGSTFESKRDGEASKEYTYRYDEATERELMEKIDQLLKLRMQNVEIALIGLWVWILGDTKPYKEELKPLGCWYHSKRSCWYWHNKKLRPSKFSGKSLSSLADRYGYKEFKSERMKEVE